MPIIKAKTVKPEKAKAFDHDAAQTGALLEILDEQQKMADKIVEAVTKNGAKPTKITATVTGWEKVNGVDRIKTLEIKLEH